MVFKYVTKSIFYLENTYIVCFSKLEKSFEVVFMIPSYTIQSMQRYKIIVSGLVSTLFQFTFVANSVVIEILLYERKIKYYMYN